VWLLSAYCKHHSTETALLYIHDHLHLTNAIGSQKVTCLCLLNLSAAFDTIDHKILITRLSSRFSIHASVLCWFKSCLSSYLSSRSFRVKCDNNLSSLHTFSWYVPQGSVLGPPFFIMYTTPLSTPISSLSLDHHHLCSSSQLWQAFRTFKKLFSRSLNEWLLIFLLLTFLRLNSCSSHSKNLLAKIK